MLSGQPGLLIARSGGSIDGINHTNSVEALRCNHARGLRWFEIDLELTSDGELVCFHEGDEAVVGLSEEISKLTIADVESKKYAGRFAIPRFSALLAEADKLSDVVLVLDTGGSKDVEQALSRVLGPGKAHPSRIVLQARGLKDVGGLAELGKSLGVGLILNVGQSEVEDTKIEEAAKQNSLLAVAVSSKRFTPWLAERLGAAKVPVWVHTVNDHNELVSLSRAGADGFYTDRYVPFERLSGDSSGAMECGKKTASDAQLRPWTERDVLQKRDYKLPKCAKRTRSAVELTSCGDGDVLRSNALPVPAGRPLRVDLDIEAGESGSSFWLELVQKGRGVLKQRELVKLAPKERKVIHYDVDLENGSPGVESRLGVSASKDRVTVHRFRLSHGATAVPEPPAPAAAEPAAPAEAEDDSEE